MSITVVCDICGFQCEEGSYEYFDHSDNFHEEFPGSSWSEPAYTMGTVLDWFPWADTCIVIPWEGKMKEEAMQLLEKLRAEKYIAVMTEEK